MTATTSAPAGVTYAPAHIDAAALGVPFRKVTLGLVDEHVPVVGGVANGGMTTTLGVKTVAQLAEVDRLIVAGHRVIRAWDVDADLDDRVFTREVPVAEWRPEPRSVGGPLPMSRRCWRAQHVECRGSWTAYPDSDGPCECACHAGASS